MALAPDGLHRSIRIGREEATDLMRSRDRLRRRTEHRSDAGKREHRPTLVESEPHHLLLLGLGVRLGGASHCPHQLSQANLYGRGTTRRNFASHIGRVPRRSDRRLPTSRKYVTPPPKFGLPKNIGKANSEAGN